MKTILVTGAGGFIGFHVCKQLLDLGFKVIGVDNLISYYSVQLKTDRVKILEQYKNFEFKKIAIEEITLFTGINIVFHFAAQPGVRHSVAYPWDTMSNVTDFLYILELLRYSDVDNFVFASSSSVNDYYPQSLYAATKCCNELMAYSYHQMYDIPCTGLRYFTVYGPWGRPDMALFKFTKAIIEGESIDVYNNGNMSRDFTYIDDIVKGTLLALLHPMDYEVFELGTGNSVKLLDFLKVIEDAVGKKAELSMTPMQIGDVHSTKANISKAEKYLGYSPETTLEDGVKDFVTWYRRYYGTEKL